MPNYFLCQRGQSGKGGKGRKNFCQFLAPDEIGHLMDFGARKILSVAAGIPTKWISYFVFAAVLATFLAVLTG